MFRAALLPLRGGCFWAAWSLRSSYLRFVAGSAGSVVLPSTRRQYHHDDERVGHKPSVIPFFFFIILPPFLRAVS